MAVLTSAALCLALIINQEARGEDLAGQVLIAHTTRNRAEMNQRTICQELKSPGSYPWFHKQRLPKTESIKNFPLFQYIALRTLEDNNDIASGATHFHNKGENPKWSHSKDFRLVANHGNHLFYTKVNRGEDEARKLLFPLPSGKGNYDNYVL